MYSVLQPLCVLGLFLCIWKGAYGTYHDFSVSIPSQMQEPILGDTVTIYCNASSPQTVVGWTANAINVADLTALSFTTSEESLTIDSFDKSYDAIYQCVAQDSVDLTATAQLSPPILVSSFENRYFVQQPALFTAYIVPLDSGLGLGYEPIAFQCELVKIFNGAQPVITWQYIETDGDPILNYTDFDNGEHTENGRYIIQYDHIGYFQVHDHSQNSTLNGSRARCVATHPNSSTEVVYSEWGYVVLKDEMFPDGLDTQPGFKAFSQVPPTIYHVEEGQTMATLPCSKVTGFHSHGILWEYETGGSYVFIANFLAIPSLFGLVSQYGGTNLRIDVSNGQFQSKTFSCFIRPSDDESESMPSTISGPAPPLPPPTVSNSSTVRQINATMDSTTILQYEIQSNETILSIWWWKDGVILTADFPQQLNGTTAMLTTSSTDTEGLYQVLVLTGTRYDFSGEIGIYDVLSDGTSAYITSSTGNITADGGSTVTLQVTAEGIPSNITYIWTKDGVVIPGEVTNTLTINGISVTDIGIYECTPSNSEGSFNTSIIQVDVRVPSINYNILTGINQSIGPSSVAGYTCTPLIPNGEITSSGDLVIADGQLDAAGTYTCTSAEINGDIVIELITIASAYITSSTGNITADNGSTVTLQVTAEGIPSNITYIWTKDGVVIPGEVTNTLTINGISVTDIGVYECTPSNSEGSFNTSIIQVDVRVLVEIGGLTDFSSTVAPIAASGYSCTPPNPNIQLLPNGTLITQDIDIDDSGVYMCTANNPSEVTGTISFNISVFLPAYVTTRQRSIRIKIGTMMALPCNAEGHPDVFTFVWKKNGIIISGANESFLIKYDVSWSDIGNYECIPSNQYGTHNTTEYTVNIEIGLNMDWLTAYEVQLLPQTINDSYQCNPPLNSAMISDNGVFTTDGLQLPDTNRYRCTTDSFNGTFIFDLKVKGYCPETPYLFGPYITTDGLAINLSWNITESRVKPVTRYILFWRLNTEDSGDERVKRHSESIAVTSTTYNLTDYDQEGIYTFWVVAENSAGRSDLSNSVDFDADFQFRLLFQMDERENIGVAVWLIVLIVILCLLCCICCLCWFILCCCLFRKKKVYHAEDEEKKHSEEMDRYRKKGEDEDLDDDDDEDEDREEGEITGENIAPEGEEKGETATDNDDGTTIEPV